ncbi:unnamed protein product [Brachionus calyciflorus]|uniref:EF-hand domain-containing protein n=1 Tax=Brachionus calyciflorus TaxID=104777 RepID=A0A813MFH7_9BILA|nr:unnamed protein product [Brachionus calyciflorus]
MGNKGGKNKKPVPSQKPTHDAWPGVPSSHLPSQPSSSTHKLTDRDLDFLSGQTGQSKSDIKAIFDEFMRNNPDGKLDKQEFVRLYSKLRPEQPESLDEISHFVFRAFDTDHNGTIDFSEFMISYSLTTRGDLKQKLNYAFSIYDADKNGYLDREELREVIFGMLDLLGADKKNNNVSLLAEQCIKELDVSNDGRVSKDEFIEGLARNYSLRALLSPFN